MCKQSFNVNNVDNNKLNINSVNVQTRIYMNSVKLRCRMLLVLILIISVKTNLQYSIHHWQCLFDTFLGEDRNQWDKRVIAKCIVN